MPADRNNHPKFLKLIHFFILCSHYVKGVQIRSFSCLCLPIFEMNKENLRIQSSCRQIPTRKSSEFGYFYAMARRVNSPSVRTYLSVRQKLFLLSSNSFVNKGKLFCASKPFLVNVIYIINERKGRDYGYFRGVWKTNIACYNLLLVFVKSVNDMGC